MGEHDVRFIGGWAVTRKGERRVEDVLHAIVDGTVDSCFGDLKYQSVMIIVECGNMGVTLTWNRCSCAKEGYEIKFNISIPLNAPRRLSKSSKSALRTSTPLSFSLLSFSGFRATSITEDGSTRLVSRRWERVAPPSPPAAGKIPIVVDMFGGEGLMPCRVVEVKETTTSR
jgi:hypothetical protein